MNHFSSSRYILFNSHLFVTLIIVFTIRYSHLLFLSVKRNRRGDARQPRSKSDQEQPSVDESSPIIQAFRKYQTELDSRHDKHERLVKLSRDVTIESKRIIFLLHRSTGFVTHSFSVEFNTFLFYTQDFDDGASLNVSSRCYYFCRNDKEEQLKEASDKFSELENSKWKSVARELCGEDPYRFLRAYSPGTQKLRLE